MANALSPMSDDGLEGAGADSLTSGFVDLSRGRLPGPWKIVHAKLPVGVKIADTRDERASAYALIYQAYRERGYVAPNAARLMYRLSYGLPSSRTFIAAHRPSAAVGTLTLIEDVQLGLPLERMFHDDVESLRAASRRVAEVGSLAIHRWQRNYSLEIFFALTRFMVQYACWRNLDDLLIAVHPRQARFYARWFHFERFGTCRRYAAVGGQPAVACRLDLRRLAQTAPPQVFERYFDTAIPSDQFAGPGIPPEEHEYFCRLVGILPEESEDRVPFLRCA